MDSLLAFKRRFLHVKWPVLSYLSFFYYLFVFFLFFFLDLVRPFLDLVRPHFLFFVSIFCIIINFTSKCLDVEFWLIFSPFPSNSSSPSLSIPPELWAVWIRLNNISLQNHPIKYKSKTSRSKFMQAMEPYLPCGVYVFLHVNYWRKKSTSLS